MNVVFPYKIEIIISMCLIALSNNTHTVEYWPISNTIGLASISESVNGAE